MMMMMATAIMMMVMMTVMMATGMVLVRTCVRLNVDRRCPVRDSILEHEYVLTTMMAVFMTITIATMIITIEK